LFKRTQTALGATETRHEYKITFLIDTGMLSKLGLKAKIFGFGLGLNEAHGLGLGLAV